MTEGKAQRRRMVSQVCSRTKQGSGERKRTVRSSNGRASWMLASVAWRSFSSTSICASVSFALAICIPRRRSNKFFFFFLEIGRSQKNRCMRRMMETYGFGLECLDGLDVLGDIVRDGLEVA